MPNWYRSIRTYGLEGFFYGREGINPNSIFIAFEAYFNPNNRKPTKEHKCKDWGKVVQLIRKNEKILEAEIKAIEENEKRMKRDSPESPDPERKEKKKRTCYKTQDKEKKLKIRKIKKAIIRNKKTRFEIELKNGEEIKTSMEIIINYPKKVRKFLKTCSKKTRTALLKNQEIQDIIKE